MADDIEPDWPQLLKFNWLTVLLLLQVTPVHKNDPAPQGTVNATFDEQFQPAIDAEQDPGQLLIPALNLHRLLASDCWGDIVGDEVGGAVGFAEGKKVGPAVGIAVGDSVGKNALKKLRIF